MARALRSLFLGLAVWLMATGLCAAADPTPAGTEIQDTTQQVLVLFRLPPEHFHPNAAYSGSYGDEMGHSIRRRIASRLAREQGLTLLSDWAMPIVGVDCFVMGVPAGRSPTEVAAALSRDRNVAWAEPMNVYETRGGPAAPNDPLFPTQPAARIWRLADLHQIATGRNVRVAVIDSMIDTTHPDLAGQILLIHDFAPDHPQAAEQHGTGVAGVIAARADNAQGIAGVAPRARLMGLRACWQQAVSPATICNSLSLAEALVFAITHDAQVINMSLSGPPDPLLGKLLDAATARGVTVVGAVNRGLPGGGFPASHQGVVAVADDAPGVTPAPGVFVAPGRDVPTTTPGGRWALVNGSSYAAAHVSGLFALMLERAPATQGSMALIAARGHGGAIDACATLLRASGPCDCACARVSDDSAIQRP